MSKHAPEAESITSHVVGPGGVIRASFREDGAKTDVSELAEAWSSARGDDSPRVTGGSRSRSPTDSLRHSPPTPSPLRPSPHEPVLASQPHADLFEPLPVTRFGHAAIASAAVNRHLSTRSLQHRTPALRGPPPVPLSDTLNGDFAVSSSSAPQRRCGSASSKMLQQALRHMDDSFKSAVGVSSSTGVGNTSAPTSSIPPARSAIPRPRSALLTALSQDRASRRPRSASATRHQTAIGAAVSEAASLQYSRLNRNFARSLQLTAVGVVHP